MCDAGVLRLCYISCSRMYSQSQSAHVPVISRDGACSTFLKKKNDYIEFDKKMDLLKFFMRYF